MITHPILLLASLVAVVAVVKKLSRTPPWNRVFDLFPVPLWCYMLPMLATTFGVFPSASPLYAVMSKWLLPVCLSWLLVGVDVGAFRGMGRSALGLMGAGFLGTVLGSALAAFLFRSVLPAEAWKSLGALAATWTGGSANMMAVKEALSAPEAVFAPVLVADGLFTYGWMVFLIWAAGRQGSFNRWTGASAGAEAVAPFVPSSPRRALAAPAAFLACAAGACGAVLLSPYPPSFGGAVTPAAWAVLLTTTGTLFGAYGLSRAGRSVPPGLEKTGAFLLLILMASLGARATISAAVRAPVFLGAAAVVLLCHAAATLAAAKMLRAPLSLTATSSQACLGGVISAPMVAAVYSPALSAVGLLMAVAANAVGTYIGLATALLCRWVMK